MKNATKGICCVVYGLKPLDHSNMWIYTKILLIKVIIVNVETCECQFRAIQKLWKNVVHLSMSLSHFVSSISQTKLNKISIMRFDYFSVKNGRNNLKVLYPLKGFLSLYGEIRYK